MSAADENELTPAELRVTRDALDLYRKVVDQMRADVMTYAVPGADDAYVEHRMAVGVAYRKISQALEATQRSEHER